MKTVEPATAIAQAKKSSPFFTKDGVKQDFFGTAGAEAPFFSRNHSGMLPIQRKLTIGQPDDEYEREADLMADKVVQRLALPDVLAGGEPQVQTKPLAATITPLLQTKCAHCEQEEKMQMKEEEEMLQESPLELQRKPIFESNAELPDDETVQRKCTACERGEKLRQKVDSPSDVVQTDPLENRLKATRSGGSPLPGPARERMENSFGADFSRVRIHSDAQAVQLSNDLKAQAFTYGDDIYFNAGKFDTESAPGKHLLAHELTHTIQQSKNINLKSIIQRTTHGGITPTNCHNWRIPLPPWTAGTYAHSQILANLAGSGIIPSMIPRATKVLMGIPNPPSITPMGFADLWQNRGTSVGIAEIKSSSQGDARAISEALHYIARHGEWATRLPMHPLDLQDSFYLGRVGGPLSAGVLDISGITGSGRNLGPFWPDPMKDLWVEGDPAGAVVYWCTGPGLPGSPVWYPLLKKIIEEAKKKLQDLKRLLEPVLEGVKAFARWVSENIGWILLIIAIIVAIVLIIVFWEAIVAFIVAAAAGLASFGTALLALLTAEEALALAIVLLGLVGIGTGSTGSSASGLISALSSQFHGSLNGSGEERDPSEGHIGGSPNTAGPNPILTFANDTKRGFEESTRVMRLIVAGANSDAPERPGLRDAIWAGIALAEASGYAESLASIKEDLANLQGDSPRIG